MLRGRAERVYEDVQGFEQGWISHKKGKDEKGKDERGVLPVVEQRLRWLPKPAVVALHRPAAVVNAPLARCRNDLR